MDAQLFMLFFFIPAVHVLLAVASLVSAFRSFNRASRGKGILFLFFAVFFGFLAFAPYLFQVHY